MSFKTFKTSSSQHEFDIKLENIGKSSQIKNECFLPTHTSCKRVLVFEMNVQKEKYPSFKDKWTNCSLWLINEETWTNRLTNFTVFGGEYSNWTVWTWGILTLYSNSIAALKFSWENTESMNDNTGWLWGGGPHHILIWMWWLGRDQPHIHGLLLAAAGWWRGAWEEITRVQARLSLQSWAAGWHQNISIWARPHHPSPSPLPVRLDEGAKMNYLQKLLYLWSPCHHTKPS